MKVLIKVLLSVLIALGVLYVAVEILFAVFPKTRAFFHSNSESVQEEPSTVPHADAMALADELEIAPSQPAESMDRLDKIERELEANRVADVATAAEVDSIRKQISDPSLQSDHASGVLMERILRIEAQLAAVQQRRSVEQRRADSANTTGGMPTESPRAATEARSASRPDGLDKVLEPPRSPLAVPFSVVGFDQWAGAPNATINVKGHLRSVTAQTAVDGWTILSVQPSQRTITVRDPKGVVTILPVGAGGVSP